MPNREIPIIMLEKQRLAKSFCLLPLFPELIATTRHTGTVRTKTHFQLFFQLMNMLLILMFNGLLLFFHIYFSACFSDSVEPKRNRSHGKTTLLCWAFPRLTLYFVVSEFCICYYKMSSNNTVFILGMEPQKIHELKRILDVNDNWKRLGKYFN